MIIFLYGEDEFRSNRKLAEIKNKFLEKNPDVTSGLFNFAEPAAKISEMLLKLSSGGLFSNKKLAIAKNILQNKTAAEDKEFLDYIKREERRDLTLIFWEKEKFDKKLRLAKFLLENAKKQEFNFLAGSKLTNWIIEEIQRTGGDNISIGPKVAEKLSIFVGNNLSLLSKEIEKLVAYKNKGEISEEDVDLLVKSKVDSDIFKTIDSLARQDKKTAVRLLHNHLGAGEDPFYLLSMYFYQFRNLLKVKALAEKKIPERDITQKLKLHPFVVRKSLEQGKGFSFDKLRNLYKNLCDVDFGAKTGKVEIELALDKFIASV